MANCSKLVGQAGQLPKKRCLPNTVLRNGTGFFGLPKHRRTVGQLGLGLMALSCIVSDIKRHMAENCIFYILPYALPSAFSRIGISNGAAALLKCHSFLTFEKTRSFWSFIRENNLRHSIRRKRW